ncbi:MAG: pyridoxal-phosphate dependent enzyme [Marmoricola sp.]
MALTSCTVSLAQLPTPLLDSPRLAEAFGVAGRILVKRDDLTGFAVAGNKARQLEALVGDALGNGADTLVTGGAPSSNFCQAAVAAARWAGLACVLVYAGSPSAERHPNHAAALHWGARILWTGDPDRASVDAGVEVAAAEVRTSGGTPYVIPRGGATPLGATAFHRAAEELVGQLDDLGVDDHVLVVLAVGSGGTAAGLLSGSAAHGRRFGVRGAAVSRPTEQTREQVLDLAAGCADLMGTSRPVPGDLVVHDARGPGHGRASDQGRAAADIALTAEGLVLDPAYSAKALAALPALLGPRAHDSGLSTVFWHTGGLLDAVAEWNQHG